MYIIIGILVVLLILMGFIIFNLNRKVEKYEDIVINQETILAGYITYLRKISSTIQESDKRMQEVDAKGSFKSDDEIGFFFQQINTIQSVLNNFIIKEEE